MLIIYFASITCIFFKLVLQFLKFLAASSFSKTLSMTNTNMVNLASVPLLVLFLSILYLLFMFRHVCFVPPSSCCFLCLECTYLFPCLANIDHSFTAQSFGKFLLPSTMPCICTCTVPGADLGRLFSFSPPRNNFPEEENNV